MTSLGQRGRGRLCSPALPRVYNKPKGRFCQVPDAQGGDQGAAGTHGDPWLCAGEMSPLAEAGTPSRANHNCRVILHLGKKQCWGWTAGGGCDRDLPRLRFSLCLGYNKLSTEGFQGAKPAGRRHTQNRVFCSPSPITLTCSCRAWKSSRRHLKDNSNTPICTQNCQLSREAAGKCAPCPGRGRALAHPGRSANGGSWHVTIST